jgi:HlyD family secretion protein
VKRWLARLLVLLVVAGAAIGGWFVYQSATRPPEFTYRTTKADRGNIVARVTATGTLSAHVTVQVGCQVSGRIAELKVDFNSPVKKGQVVARIDPQLFEATLASARANRFAAQGAVAQARAQALLAERNLARARSLRAEGLNSQADLDSADAAMQVARAQIEAAKGNFEQARAQEHQATINLAYTTIVSPIDGTVISRGVDVGQTVAASLQAPTLFTIAEDLRQMQVDTNVTEGDVGKLRAGMVATFAVDAYTNKRFSGTIRQIRNAPQTVQNVVTYDAVIDVQNESLDLKPGMTANVTIEYERRDGALRVPNTALRFRPPPALAGSAGVGRDGGRGHRGDGSAPAGSGRRRHGGASSASPEASAAPALSGDPVVPAATGSASAAPQGPTEVPPERRSVWVLRGAQPVQVWVRTGLSDGTLTEIVSGELSEGDDLILEATSADDASGSAGTGKPPGGASQPRMRL